MLDTGFLHLSKPPGEYAQKVIEDLDPELDLDEENSEQKLEMLQKLPVEEIVKRNALFEGMMFIGIPWLPIVDSHSSQPFIPKSSKVLLPEGSFNKAC